MKKRISETCSQCGGTGGDEWMCPPCAGSGSVDRWIEVPDPKPKGKKGNSNNGGGGCFITTATLLATGKEDNCEELQVFRNFRDEWVLNQPNGTAMVESYYSISPSVVDSINLSPNSKEEYKKIWSVSLEPCYKLILQGEFNEAQQLYIQTMKELQARFQ